MHFVDVITTAREILEHDSGWAAFQLNKVISMQTHEEIMNFYQSWVKNPKILKNSEVFVNSLIASSSPRFNVYDNDFGWGRPVAVRTGAGNKHDGYLTIFCGAEQGSIDIEVNLAPQTLHAMGHDTKFMAAVTKIHEIV
uniref:Putative ovule protein n=1 Tax=Solanum chacoense TaxID=4108 RepID=A0A0V0GU93_SOLCH